MSTSSSHACIIGASFAGLLAARVLAERFERVTLFDRDALPLSPAHRRHAPQSHHYHGLLFTGCQILSALFDGFEEEMRARGARFRDAGSGVWRVVQGSRHDRSPLGADGCGMSRILIEDVIRRRVREIPNVDVQDRVEVVEPLVDERRERSIGLRIRREGVLHDVPADLVIDCSGRGSRLPTWLEAKGFEAPRVETQSVDARYRTRRFRLAPGDLDDLRTLFVTAVPGCPRFGVIGWQEDGSWLCSLGGLGGEQAPADVEGFIDFARRLAAPDLHDVLRRAEPIGEALAFRTPTNLRRRYEQVDRHITGLIALGDAVCSFNPTYGQGMTVAAQQAMVLRTESGPSSLDPRSWYREIAPIIDRPWAIVTRGDAAALGGRPRGVRRFLAAYLNRLHAAAARDAVVSHAFLRVANLQESIGTLIRPAIALRVLRANAGGHS